VLDSRALQQAAQQATSGDDLLNGLKGNDTLSGGAGNDRIHGHGGTDVLTGGAGHDEILTGSPDGFAYGATSVIHYALGDGYDTIRGGPDDVVKLGAGIRPEDLIVIDASTPQVAAFNVLLKDGSGGFQLKAISTDTTYMPSVQFAAGPTLTGSELYAQRLANMPSDGGDMLYAAPTDASKGQGSSVNGLRGNDSLIGHLGDDTLDGGSGNDTLEGGRGADTYLYARGDDHDVIRADGQDRIVFGQGISKGDIAVGRVGENGQAGNVVLSIQRGGQLSTDSITLENAGSWNGLQLAFADGGSLSGADIMVEANRPVEPPKPPNLKLDGTAGKDKLQGQDGNDTLNGLAGADTLSGGKGKDTLIGGKGNDSYVFNAGDEHDTIVDQDGTWFNSDQLRINAATSKQLWLSRTGNSLDVAVIGTRDHVTIQDWFLSSSNRVEKIVASDGKTLNLLKVSSLINAMAAFAPPAEGITTMPTALNKAVTSSWY
jgi:Ca2+-binding RTX toxin-like protein